jgi:hypothetical protein
VRNGAHFRSGGFLEDAFEQFAIESGGYANHRVTPALWSKAPSHRLGHEAYHEVASSLAKLIHGPPPGWSAVPVDRPGHQSWSLSAVPMIALFSSVRTALSGWGEVPVASTDVVNWGTRLRVFPMK